MDSLERTLAEIRSKAAELRNSFGDEERARAIEWAASLVERALQEHAEERLTLAEASARSGYSQDRRDPLMRVRWLAKQHHKRHHGLLKHKAPAAQLPTVLRVRPVGTAGFERECRERERAAAPNAPSRQGPRVFRGGRVGTAGFEPATP